MREGFSTTARAIRPTSPLRFNNKPRVRLAGSDSSDIILKEARVSPLILLSNTDIKEAAHVAEKLKDWIADHPVHIADDYFSMTVSVGVASDNSYNLESLLKRADKAMYKAKQAGRNQVIYDEKDIIPDDRDD